MTNINLYDQGGLGPLVNPGSKRTKKITVPPGFLSHNKQKRQNCQISKCGTARGKNVNIKNEHRLNANDFWYDLWVINIFISSVCPYS